MRDKAPSLVKAVGNYLPLADDKKQAPPAPPAVEALPAPERGTQETPAPEVPEPAVEEPVVALPDHPDSGRHGQRRCRRSERVHER